MSDRDMLTGADFLALARRNAAASAEAERNRRPDDLAVFHRDNLPADTAETPWPRSPSGIPFMPMSGTYIVRFADGDATHTDGFLLVQSDGEPAWTSEPPP